MRHLRTLLYAVVMAAATGCGGGDPNKNLKPIDPNAPRPQVGSDKGQADKPATPQ